MRFLKIRLLLVTTLMCVTALSGLCQEFSVESLFFLPDQTKESSGLIFLNDRLITHNDSGDEPKLYELDPESEQLSREVSIEQVRNRDWEDLCIDQEFLYIADIGNNQGDRKDLKIYRVRLSEYLLGNNSVAADSILFSYEDQTSFISTPLSNFDAEALISYGDSLYIFTKNWADLHTNIYSIPKAPGDYQANKVGRINTEGLITGGVYNPNTDEIMLVGYDFQRAFLTRLWNFEDEKFDQGEMARYPFDIQGSFQMEAIEIIDDTDYYVTSESNDFGEARLWRIHTEFVVGLEEGFDQSPLIYPNPAGRSIHFRGSQEPIQAITLYNLMGSQLQYWKPDPQQSKQGFTMDLINIPEGVYLVRISTRQKELQQRLIVVQ